MDSRAEEHQTPHDLVDLRAAAIDVVKRLTEANHEAYFAGGCVRDRLMGHEPTDYDVATSAKPPDVAKIFPRVHTVGESFGVMLVRTKSHMIQVATFRTEGVYSDGRHPDTVAFSDAKHDASRRDFTINGLFENPLTGEVIDYVGGQADLKARVIRAIGDPHARLREDRLRMLRAVRFAARFGFSIEPETADTIRTGSSKLEGVSRERIGQEVKRMLTDANRAVAAWELQSLGLDEQTLMEPSRRPALTHMSGLPDDATYPTSLAAWLLDRHPKITSEPAADGGLKSPLNEIVNRWTDALMLSNDERAGLVAALSAYGALMFTWQQMGVAGQKRLAAGWAFQEGILLVQSIDRDRLIEIRRRVSELSQTGLSPPPLITGNDLISIGLRPGPLFSRVLEATYNSQLEGAVQTQGDALELAKELAKKLGEC